MAVRKETARVQKVKSVTQKQVMDLTETQEHKMLNNYSNTSE
jgi:hypothetical protein